MKYRHIVFDMDGTLVNTEFAVLHSLQETIRELSGREIPCAELTFALGITGADALKRLGIKDAVRAIGLWNSKMSAYADTVTVFDGIPAVLGRLLTLQYSIGIVTSRTREELQYDLTRLGMGRCFQTVICADDTQEHKPNAAPLLKYMEASGAEGGEALYVGDSAYDSKCAENAGVAFALAGWGSRGRSIPADYFLEQLSGLLSVIEDR